MVSEFKLGNRKIGDSEPAYVIAELGHNHGGSLQTAIQLIDAAAAAGVHAVKLQKRDNKRLYTREMYAKPYDNENSYGATYGEHREALEFEAKQYLVLKAHAENHGMAFFATPFDIPSVDFLDRIGCPAFKIASGCITDIPLIDYAASKGKPLFISTGGCELADIDRAYDAVAKHGVPLCIMHCIASYPLMDYTLANMNVISELRKRYSDATIGFSSHESGIMLPVAAYVLGARVVEKHFTLNRAMKGTDHKFSVEPTGMQKMCRDLARIHQAMGSGSKHAHPCEQDPIRKMSKSIYSKSAICKGTAVGPHDLCFKSPGGGLPPHMAEELLGRKSLSDIPAEFLLKLDMFSTGKPTRKWKNINWSSYGAE